MEDEDTDAVLRKWLDGDDSPLPWTSPDHVTSDEWFFITTLYGEMTLDGQRTHIRKYYPLLFVEATVRDVRNFVPDMSEYEGLRSGWMKTRLAKMGQILRDRDLTMDEYTEQLRSIEKASTPRSPTRAPWAGIMAANGTEQSALLGSIALWAVGWSQVEGEVRAWRMASMSGRCDSLWLSMVGS